MDGEAGFEPAMPEPKSGVLPATPLSNKLRIAVPIIEAGTALYCTIHNVKANYPKVFGNGSSCWDRTNSCRCVKPVPSHLAKEL